ncbi:hypothetical protein DFA_01820 [Cavenderia fasciculata]|uniref:Uncharacterized protein n=1 Tax=Cavenderia fasciculata TaxID=261658 RepID=F4PUX2_CACFS|nr:uncharacterized protein DFA_01820 [Cavenderia fasciculata]EGG21934.1 hypothetical protein DFA_01820 [Cavenderia fasciculata]|eukprot:XP_004359785.1 hypothetical protein DFA_01820 [Cavenderia fasciculata]
MNQPQQQQQLSHYLDQFILGLLFKECSIDDGITRYSNEIISLASVCKRWLKVIKIALSRFDSKSHFLKYSYLAFITESFKRINRDYDQFNFGSEVTIPSNLIDISDEHVIGKSISFKAFVQRHSKQLKQVHCIDFDQDWIDIFPLTTLTRLSFQITSLPKSTPIFPPTIEYLSISEHTINIDHGRIDFNEWKLDQLPRLVEYSGGVRTTEYEEKDFFILFDCISASPTFKHYTQLFGLPSYTKEIKQYVHNYQQRKEGKRL